MISVNLNSQQWDVHSCHLTPSSLKQTLSPGKSFVLSVYISLLILSHSYTNQENLKIKWWKYRSKELLKPFPFCHQKKLDWIVPVWIFFLTQHKCAVGASIPYLKINVLLQAFPYLVDGMGPPELAKNVLIPPSTREILRSRILHQSFYFCTT